MNDKTHAVRESDILEMIEGIDSSLCSTDFTIAHLSLAMALIETDMKTACGPDEGQLLELQDRARRFAGKVEMALAKKRGD
jgi:hypothetical protein